jgi:integrase
MGNGWQIRIRRKGYPAVYETYRTKGAARRRIREIEHLMDEGKWRDSAQAATTTLGEALERYRHQITPWKKGATQEDQLCRRLQKRKLAEYSLANLRGKHLAEYRDQRLKEGRSRATVRNELAALHHLFEVARQEWGMEALDNPVKNVRKPKVPQGRDRRLKPGEEERILGKAREMDLELWVFLVVALETGMRSGEILDVTWGEVALDRKVIRKLDDTKNDGVRGVPLTTRAVQAFRSLGPEEEGRVFRWEKPNGVSQRFRDDLVASLNREAKEQGLEPIMDLRIHDLRHEATSRFFENTDFDLMEISEITGHRDLRMLKRYTHLRADRLAERLN